MLSATTQAKPTASISVPSQNTSRDTSPIPAVPAQPPKPSYAKATKPSAPIEPTIARTPLNTTGAQAPVQHGKVDNHRPAASMSNQPSAGGIPQTGHGDFSRTDSHGRKPSVVISASGASGQLSNGGPVGQNNARPNINFGSMLNNQASPAIANSTPQGQHGSGLQPQNGVNNPRITSPAHSPSPIPQPPTSGGKPPAGLQGQGNGLVFGSSGMDNGDANVSAH